MPGYSCQNYQANLGAPRRTSGRWNTGSCPKTTKRSKRRNQSASYVSDTRGKNVAGRELGPIWKFKQ